MKTIKLKTILMLSFIAFCSGALLTGCGTKVPPGHEAVMRTEYQGAPDWVMRGCSTYWNAADARRMICGVGASDGTLNPTMARESATGRARADIAKKIRVTVTSILKDYQATTTGGAHYGTDADDEQHIESITKEITDMNLPGTEMVDSWISDNGTYYVLVALDVEKFKDSIHKTDDLSGKLKNAIFERVDQALENLEIKSRGQNNEK